MNLTGVSIYEKDFILTSIQMSKAEGKIIQDAQQAFLKSQVNKNTDLSVALKSNLGLYDTDFGMANFLQSSKSYPMIIRTQQQVEPLIKALSFAIKKDPSNLVLKASIEQLILNNDNLPIEWLEIN